MSATRRVYGACLVRNILERDIVSHDHAIFYSNCVPVTGLPYRENSLKMEGGSWGQIQKSCDVTRTLSNCSCDSSSIPAASDFFMPQFVPEAREPASQIIAGLSGSLRAQ